MKNINTSQQTQQIAGLEEQTTPVLGQEVTAIARANPNSDTNKPVSRSRRHLLPKVALAMSLGAGAIASGIYGYRWWQYAQRYQETDNAYVSADIYTLTSPISGVVTEVAVNDNQMVSPGVVLVKLDKRDHLLSLAQAKASLELAKQQAALAQENLKLVAINTSFSDSVPVKLVTQAKQAATRDNVLQTQVINQQREINQQQYKTAQATIAQKQAEVKKAELQLSYTEITALVPGKVGNKNVQVGQRVQAGQTLITVVQPRPWIIANFKETQLEKIQPGQKVEIKIAAFPSRKFRGKVDSMSPTSFGRYAVLPQDNATGNSNKSSDVQRIPVKILLDTESIQGYEPRITPGMSAIAVVETK